MSGRIWHAFCMNEIESAFQKVDRAIFLPEDVKEKAALDIALPIGYGQTNSQPTTVQLMLEWLEVRSGDKVLDIGSGSGWTTALLAVLTGKKGRVIAVERIPELVERGQDNVEHLDIRNASFYGAEDELGLSALAPYDRILVSASADVLPLDLLDQLKLNGKIVIPVQSSILEVTKTKDSIEIEAHPGFAFVPLV